MYPKAHDPCNDSEDEFHKLERPIKLVIVGERGSGKTCLLYRFAENKFFRAPKPTVGVDFFKKAISLPGIIISTVHCAWGLLGNIEATLQMWDVSGQSIQSEMLQNYVSGCQGVLFVFDMHQPNSFERLDMWFSRVQDCLALEEGQRRPAFVLVANKMDLQYQTTLERQAVEKFSQRNGLPAHFVSAKTGEGVQQCFLGIACAVLGIHVRVRDYERTQPVLQASLMTNQCTAHTQIQSPKPRDNEQNVPCEHAGSVCQLL